MDSRVEKNQKSVVDQAMLRAFAKGQLDEVTEDKIVALLEERPELQAKVAAISTDDILLKMKAYSQNIAAMSQARQVGVDPSVDGQLPPNISGRHAKSMTPILDLPAELAALTDYKVICELGRGGMGVVYLAEHTITGRKEVLKVLNERLMTHQEARKRFEQEIKCTAALNHESIIRCYTVRTLPRTVVLAMEYVHGMDLQKFVATNGRLPIHLACGIASEVCLGLQHAMKEGLVHRDIKPSNIMLYKTDGKIKAKILDFGLARLANSDQQCGLTQDGTLLGTLEYIAPEQCMNANKVDSRADIYSLGCTLYHMLVGHAPFSGSQGELILAHAQTIPSAVNLVRRDVPVELGEVVAKMLAKQPERRFLTPNDVAVALEPFLSRRITESTASKLSMIGAPETLGPAAEAQRDTSVEFERARVADNEAVPDATASTGASQSVVIVTSPKARARSHPAMRTSGSGKGTSRKWLSIGGSLFGALLLCALVIGIIKIRTTNGTIVIENLPADAEVLVDGDKVEIKWDGQHAIISAKSGERRLQVKQGDVLIEGEVITVATDQQSPVKLTLENSDLKVSEISTRRPLSEFEKVPSDSTIKVTNNVGDKANNAASRRMISAELRSSISAMERVRLVGESPRDAWRVHEDELRIEGPTLRKWQDLYFGDPEWRDFDFHVELKVEKQGEIGIFICSQENDKNRWVFNLCAFGGKDNTDLLAYVGGIDPWKHSSRRFGRSSLNMQFDKWYQLHARVRGNNIEIFVDGKSLCQSSFNQLDRGRCGLHTYGCPIGRFRNFKVVDSNGGVLWQGLPDIENAFEGEEPIPRSVGENVDLLSMVAPQRDSVRGQWELKDNTLIGLSGSNRRLQIPYRVAGSYRISMEFSRKSGKEGVSIILPIDNTTTEMVLSGNGATMNGISLIDERWIFDRTSSKDGVVAGNLIRNGFRHKLEVETTVHLGKVSVDAFLDDKPLLSWSGDTSQLTPRLEVNLPVQGAPGIWSFSDEIHVFRFNLVHKGVGTGKSLVSQIKEAANRVQADWTPIFSNGILADNVANRGYTLNKEGHIHSKDTAPRILSSLAQVSDIHIRMEYRTNGEGLGAVFFRSPNGFHKGTKGDNRGVGYVLDFGYSGRFDLFSAVFMSGRTRKIFTFETNDIAADKWQTLEIIAMGQEITVLLNGTVVGRYNDSEYSRGYWGVHSGTPGYEIRKLEFKDLGKP